MRLADIYGLSWSHIRPFDEDAVEASCTSLAMARWSGVSPERSAEFEDYFQDAYSSVGPSRDDENICGLVEDGLLWQPPDHCQLIPTAWAVRGTAISKVGNGRIERAALVNSMLVSEALAWCFQLEAVERARFDANSDVTDCSEAHEHYAKFLEGKKNSAAQMYPKAYPFRLSAKDFVPFGWFCNQLGMEKRTLLRKQLLNLRNCLSHGHFAGWSTIYDLVTLQAKLIG